MWNPLAEPIIDRATLERVIDEQRAALAKRDELLIQGLAMLSDFGANGAHEPGECEDCDYVHEVRALLAEGKG